MEAAQGCGDTSVHMHAVLAVRPENVLEGRLFHRAWDRAAHSAGCLVSVSNASSMRSAVPVYNVHSA